MQALNLDEPPQKEDDGRAQQQQPHQQQQQQQLHHPQHQQPPPGSPVADTGGLVNGGGDYGRQHEGGSPMRQNTTSSTTTVASLASLATGRTTPTPYSLEAHTPSSPSLATTAQAAAQAVFSARDGADVTAQRRASRRRTGPLNPEQREKASLIRKMGACGDCKRRRVACHPSHHNTTWAALAKKFGNGSSSQSANGRPLSPAMSKFQSLLTQEPEDMVQIPNFHERLNQMNPNDSRIRTPLPSGPRPERPTSLIPVAGLESFRVDLQGSASRILASPLRSRYASVSTMLVRWQDDIEDADGSKNDIEELARVLTDDYNYSVTIKNIPTSGDPSNSSYLWLNREVNTFVTSHNQRDTLKIFYYSGHSYLGEDRDTMISSSKKATPGSDIPWKMIQGMFENICSDALILLDCAYYPLYQTVRRQGILELIAASAGEDHAKLLGRSAFTRALTEQLKTRAVHKFKEAYSASELHAKLVSVYPSLVREQNQEIITSFPTPLFVQLSGNKVLPSILLAPLVARQPGDLTPSPYTPDSPAAGTSQLSLTFQISDDNTFNMESWAEWLRSMPQGIKDLKIDGPYRSSPWAR
ncbi:hypothetical protein QC762_111580 [Podospora pseudocomata]|uniref:Peptidase C14 caspase domain-containing protein n=1 Tax=Podospora pseudocomata TaxID=2093779 RepID=A0ABR0GV00_9PEZI|nr:hypothetical protein QC762_111580 [Podospora pseudocomata]